MKETKGQKLTMQQVYGYLASKGVPRTMVHGIRYSLIQDAVVAAMRPEKKEKPGRKAGIKTVLDMGKVHALKDAGWSADKIGLEFGVSGQTILNRLKEEEENG